MKGRREKSCNWIKRPIISFRLTKHFIAIAIWELMGACKEVECVFLSFFFFPFSKGDMRELIVLERMVPFRVC